MPSIKYYRKYGPHLLMSQGTACGFPYEIWKVVSLYVESNILTYLNLIGTSKTLHQIFTNDELWKQFTPVNESTDLYVHFLKRVAKLSYSMRVLLINIWKGEQAITSWNLPEKFGTSQFDVVLALCFMHRGSDKLFRDNLRFDACRNDYYFVKQSLPLTFMFYEGAPIHIKTDLLLQAVRYWGPASMVGYPSHRLTLDVVWKAIHINGLCLTFCAPEFCQDRRLLSVAVERCPPGGLHYHPLKYTSEALRRDRDIAYIAVYYEGLALSIVDKEHTDNNLIVAVAVSQNGLALKYATKRLQDDEYIVRLASRQNVWAFQYASWRLRGHRDLALDVIASYRGVKFLGDLGISPKLLDDREFVLEGARAGTGFMPHQYFKDKSVVMAAMSGNGSLLRLVPEFQDDADVVQAAVAQYPDALEFASARLRDDPRITHFVGLQNGSSMRFASLARQRDLPIPPELTAYYWAVRSRNPDQLNIKEVMQALSFDGRIIKWLPFSLRDDARIVLTAVSNYSEALRFASARLRNDPQTVIDAAILNGSSFEHASGTLRYSLDFCCKIVQLNTESLNSIPQSLFLQNLYKFRSYVES